MLARELGAEYHVGIIFPHQGQICLIEDGREVSALPGDVPQFPVTPEHQPLTERAFSELASRFSPDIIHIQHFHNWPLSVLELALDVGCPVAMTFHDYYTLTPHWTMQYVSDVKETLSPEYSKRIFGSDISPYLNSRRALIAKALPRLKLAITPSQFVKTELQKIFPLDFRVVEWGIPEFPRSPRKPNPEALVFGCVGSLIPQKGWESLLKAFPLVRKQSPGAELHFYGGGSTYNGPPVPGVQFHGIYYPKDIPEVCSRFDVGVIPSIFAETFSLVLSELWMAGRAVAVADIGALGERVRDKVNGVKFPAGDCQGIAQALLWFTMERQWLNWEVPKPRTLPSMVAEFNTLYRNLLNG